MPKTEVVPELVIAVLDAVHRATRHRRPPFYVGVSTLLTEATQDRIDMATRYAQLAGWLHTGGDPVHSCSISATGITLLKDKRLA